MTNGRRARKAKQDRRDARRAKVRGREGCADPALTDAIRSALAGHPLDLLNAASMAIQVEKRDSATRRCDTSHLDRILTGLIDMRCRETTSLLAVIAELLVDDPERQLRCQREVAERGDHLPRWVTALPQVVVYRAVRRTHVFGDVDEVVLGMRLDGQHELTVAVQIDHNMWSNVADAGVVPDPIDDALARVAETSSDTSVFELTLADARAWIEGALDKPGLPTETDAWPFYLPLVRWLVGRMPEGGERRPAAGERGSSEEVCDQFFATDAAAPFTDSGHRELLQELFETGTGDPLRWSAARVEHAIGGTAYIEDHIPLEVALDAPDLLRAFVPHAHAQSGIRDDLTSQTLMEIDALRSRYKREVLRRAKYWGLDDAV